MRLRRLMILDSDRTDGIAPSEEQGEHADYRDAGGDLFRSVEIPDTP